MAESSLWRRLEELPRRRPRALRALLLVPITVVLAVFFVVPLVQLLDLSLDDGEDVTLALNLTAAIEPAGCVTQRQGNPQ